MSDAHDELAALTLALQKTVSRRGRLGARRLAPGAPAPSQIETEPATTPPSPVASSTPATEPAPGATPAPPMASTPASQAALAAGCPNLEQLGQATAHCQACALHQGREKPVFSQGATGPGQILFLGSSPSAEDNRSGMPFSGPPGQLLTDIIQKGMGLDRQRVTITHLVKCPTPDGRAPSDEEISLCAPWLQRQLELVAPAVLIPLGQAPANFLLGTKAPLQEIRNQVYQRLGRSIVPTFAPSELLQEPAKKRDCWADIQRAMAAAGIAKKP